jgi:glutathione S-transferase
MSTPRVYGMSTSGNRYKVRLLLEQLQQAYEWIEIDVRTGLTREPEFLGRNPNGRVPTLEYEPGKFLAESDAILVYLAEGSAFWPQQRLQRAQALQWMFFEQYSHEPYVATPRFIKKHMPAESPRHAELSKRLEQGRAALAVMEAHLAMRRYFVAERYTIADIALYAYTHVADEGGLELGPYPHVRAWLARAAAEPGHVPLTRRPP